MIIDVQGVNFRYRGSDKAALRNLSFQVREGEIFGFLGPSGAGKSTTLGILTGTLVGWGGSALVRGIDPRNATRNFYREIGVCFESPRFHGKFTARENLRLFGDLYSLPLRDAEALLGRLALADAGDKRVEAFSKGMKTRLSFIRSLIHNPSLLFLDEPTNGLDPALTQSVWEMIREERDRGATIFLTTHDMATAGNLCDRVGFLVDGELVLVDNPKQLALQYGRPELRIEYRRDENAEGRETACYPMDSLADNPGFLDLLRSGKVETLHSGEASLDEIFRLVTGRVLV